MKIFVFYKSPCCNGTKAVTVIKRSSYKRKLSEGIQEVDHKKLA
jgi:hypothetical protein